MAAHFLLGKARSMVGSVHISNPCCQFGPDTDITDETDQIGPDPDETDKTDDFTVLLLTVDC